MRNLQESRSFRSMMKSWPGNYLGRRGPARLVLLFLCMLLQATLPAQELDPPCPGDVNLDGNRASGDLALLSAHLAGERVFEDEALAHADVNLDRIVDVGDVTRLLQHTTGEFPLIPCGEFDPIEIACPGLSISPSSAQPLENVSLGSLPDELAEPILALVTEEGKEAGILAFVDRLENGTATLSVPFYPGGTLEGGPVNVRVTDGFSACAPASFSIDAIPPAPGEFSRVADALQESVDARAEDLGLAADELISIDGEVPAYVIPLAIAQRLLDHPENPDSLRAMSEGTAPFLEGDTDNTVLDGVAAWLNLADLFGVAGGRSGAVPVQADGSPLACGDSVENLDACMRLAKTPVDLNRPNQETALSLLAMKLFPGSGVGGSTAKAVFDKISATTELSSQVQFVASLATATLLPSRFASFKVDANPELLEEDSVEEGEWTAELTATSQGWKLQVSRSELLKQLARGQLSGAAGKASELAEKFFPGQGEKLGKKLGNLLGNNAGEVAPETQEDDTNFEIPPETFGPVSDGLNEEEWTRVEIRGNAVEQVEHNKYRAVKATDEGSRIVVEVRTDGDKFGGVAAARNEVRVRVYSFQVRGPGCVEPGSTGHRFVADVTGLPNKNVMWEATNGSIRANGVFDAPEQPGEAVIKATSVFNPDIQEETVVRVGGCDCYWTIKVGGRPQVTSQTGDRNTFFRTTEQVSISLNNEDGEGLTANFLFEEQFVGVAGSLGLDEESEERFAYSGDNEDEEAFVSGSLSENSATAVEGFIVGLVEVTDLIVKSLETFEVKFRITADPNFLGIFPGCRVE